MSYVSQYTQQLKREVKIDALESRSNEIHDALLKHLGPVEYGHAILSDKYPEGAMGNLTQKYLKEACEAQGEVKRLRAICAERQAGFLPPRDY